MQLLYIDPVSASLIKSHVVEFQWIYLLLDNNLMTYFLFNLKAKKVSIFRDKFTV